VLTVTRIRFTDGGTGGQNQKVWLPSGLPPPSPGMPRCSAPASSVARTWKLGTIIGQYSPLSHGYPYSWMDTRSPCAAMFSITAVARRSGIQTASPASPARSGSLSRARRCACRPHSSASSSCQPGAGASRAESMALSGGSAPVHSSASATAATIFATSSSTLSSPVAIVTDRAEASSAR